MKSFDFVFLGSVLASAVLIARAAYLLIRGKWARAGRTGLFLVGFVAAYAGVLIGVSLSSRTRYVPLGTEFRFDDWCFAVVGAERAPAVGPAHAIGVFELVTVQVSNRGRGRAQREKNVGAYLLDAAGKRYGVSEAGQTALDSEGRGGSALDSMVNAGDSIRRTLVFTCLRMRGTWGRLSIMVTGRASSSARARVISTRRS